MSGLSELIAVGAGSFNYYRVVTSSTSFALVYKSYSDTSCSSEMASLVIGDSDVTIGDNVTGLTTGTQSIGTTGTQVTSKQYCMKGKGTTDNGTAWLNTFTNNTYITGEEQIGSGSGQTFYFLWHADNSSTRSNSSLSGYQSYSGNVWRSRGSSSAQPTDWNDGGAQDGFQN